MEPRGKLLKELIEDFRAKGAGMDALDKAKEAFKSLEGRMPTKEEYASVISNTKKSIKNIISPAQEPAAESLKETPVVGKALENLKKTFNNVPASTTTEALQQEAKVTTQIEPSIKEEAVLPQPKAQLEGIEVPGPGKIPEDPLTGIRALPESKASSC